MKYIRGHRWYPSLNRDFGLLESEDVNGKLIVCYTPAREPEERRYYSAFGSYIEFYRFYSSSYDRHFHEVILGSQLQKPRFDIDFSSEEKEGRKEGKEEESLEKKGWSLLERIITACQKILCGKLNLEKDVLIFTSIDYKEKKKFSAHLVLNNYCHGNNREAKAFFDLVLLELEPQDKEYIDSGVYSTKQNFRIFGCSKYHSRRVKSFHESFEYQGVVYSHQYPVNFDKGQRKELFILGESLITVVQDSVLIPIEVNEEIREIVTVTDKQVQETLILAKDRLKSFPFSLRDITNGIISLQRKEVSFCPTCQRNHEKENPMLLLRDNKVYWNCRRTEKNYYLGSINVTEEKVEKEEAEVRKKKEKIEEKEDFQTIDSDDEVEKNTNSETILRKMKLNFKKREPEKNFTEDFYDKIVEI